MRVIRHNKTNFADCNYSSCTFNSKSTQSLTPSNNKHITFRTQQTTVYLVHIQSSDCLFLGCTTSSFTICTSWGDVKFSSFWQQLCWVDEDLFARALLLPSFDERDCVRNGCLGEREREREREDTREENDEPDEDLHSSVGHTATLFCRVEDASELANSAIAPSLPSTAKLSTMTRSWGYDDDDDFSSNCNRGAVCNQLLSSLFVTLLRDIRGYFSE
jgi:hypothetical protein